MKTLHLTSAWHEKSGGIATFYKELIAAANLEKHFIRLVVPAAADSVEEIGAFAKIYHLAAPSAPLNPAYRVLYPSQFISRGSKIQRIVREEQPDLVEVCDKYNLNYFAALLRLGLLPDVNCRPPVIGLTCERMDDNFRAYLGGGHLGKAFCRFYMHWLYFPFFDHHIAVSQHTAAELAPAAQGHPVSRSVWIRPMGVDTSLFSPARRSAQGRLRLLRSCGAERDCALLLYAGRLAPEKNLGLLVDLMEQLIMTGPQFRLLIAGDGIELGRLKARAQARVPGKLTFLGHVHDRQTLADLYANCDIFLHPNPNEPFGIAPLEAMATGTPLVAPNTGGVTSYANMENAWVVDPTGAAFARAVLEALTDGEVRKQKTGAAIVAASRFSWPNMASQYLRLYREMAGLRRGAPHSPGMEPAFTSSGAHKNRARIIESAARLASSTFGLWKQWIGEGTPALETGRRTPEGTR